MMRGGAITFFRPEGFRKESSSDLSRGRGGSAQCARNQGSAAQLAHRSAAGHVQHSMRSGSLGT